MSIICAQLGKEPHRGQDTKVRVSVARGQLLLASWLDLSPDWLQTLGSCCQSCCCPLDGAHKAGVLTMVKCAGQSEDAAGMQQIADRRPRATTTRHLHTMNCLSSCFVLPQTLAHTHTHILIHTDKATPTWVWQWLRLKLYLCTRRAAMSMSMSSSSLSLSCL